MSKSIPSQLIARRLAAEPSRLMELLPSLREAERRHICQMIIPIVNDAEKWLQSYPFLPSGLVLPVAIVSIAQHPGHGFDEISTYVRMVLWISGFDDYFDDARLDTEALVRIKRDCLDISCGKPPIDVHPTASSLAELIVRLQKFPGWHVLDRQWLVALVQVAESTVYEYFTRRAPGHRYGSSLQRPYAEYMYFAELTAALSFLWTTDLILVEDRGMRPT